MILVTGCAGLIGPEGPTFFETYVYEPNNPYAASKAGHVFCISHVHKLFTPCNKKTTLLRAVSLSRVKTVIVKVCKAPYSVATDYLQAQFK